MKTYTDTIDGKTYIYFYDKSIRLWTIMELDKNGNQIWVADNEVRKSELKAHYKVTFKHIYND